MLTPTLDSKAWDSPHGCHGITTTDSIQIPTHYSYQMQLQIVIGGWTLVSKCNKCGNPIFSKSEYCTCTKKNLEPTVRRTCKCFGTCNE